MTPARQIVRVDGRPIPVRGGNIDTDRIIPARFLRSVTFEGLEKHVFADDRQALAAEGQRHVFDNPAYRGAAILVVNANFGCGSSREHAPQALARWGIRAAVGESFSEIFFGNAVLLGMPCATAGPGDVEWLLQYAESAPAESWSLSLPDRTLHAGGRRIDVFLPPAVRESFLTGAWDATGLLLDRYEEVERVAESLPYLREFQDSRRSRSS